MKNPSQIAIVKSPSDENVLVLAGPGSGKTRVVVHRCAYLLRVERARPESVIVLCYNHNAAMKLRKDLRNLVGSDAAGVTVMTYHSMAMRLTGKTFLRQAENATGTALDFKRVILEATALLNGEKDICGLDADEFRDRLLSGYQHILVDEYQDIDEDQYDMVSALVGRKSKEHEKKLTILAVGDDDQNIYTFRGASIRFLKKFQEDYRATVRYLVENYRSSKHIIACANCLIANNKDRKKRTNPFASTQKEKPVWMGAYGRSAIRQGGGECKS